MRPCTLSAHYIIIILVVHSSTNLQLAITKCNLETIFRERSEYRRSQRWQVKTSSQTYFTNIITTNKTLSLITTNLLLY